MCYRTSEMLMVEIHESVVDVEGSWSNEWAKTAGS